MSDATAHKIIDRVLSSLPDDPNLQCFGRILLQATDPADVIQREPAAIADDVKQAFECLGRKHNDLPAINIRRLNGTAPIPLTAIEICNDDMPFLVDSVMGEIQSRGLTVHRVAHPLFKTVRDSDGHLRAVLFTADPTPAQGRPESFILIHIEALSATEEEDLKRTLQEILAEVRIAVTDWPAIRDVVRGEITRLKGTQDANPEVLAFLGWLEVGNFVFLGSRRYLPVGDTTARDAAPVPKSGLGLLRPGDVRELQTLARPTAPTQPEAPTLLRLTKASLISRVHRRAALDLVILTTIDAVGTAVSTLTLAGLFTSRAYVQSVKTIPILREKTAMALAAARYPEESHAGKALVNVLETFPRDELFQISDSELLAWSKSILDLDLRPRVRLFARRDALDRYVAILIYAPRDHWTSSLRERIGALLSAAYGGHISDFHPYFPEGPLVRVQFTVTRDATSPQPPEPERLENDIAALLRTWTDRLIDSLAQAKDNTGHWRARYASAFSAGYAEFFPPARALEDIARIERLSNEHPVVIDFYRDATMPQNRVHAAIYRSGDPIRLSERVPILENLGFSVIDERSFTVTPQLSDGERRVTLHDMVLETADASALDLGAHDRRLEAAFLSVFTGACDNDPFNRLVIAAGADWREAALLRAYASYLRQLNVPFGLRYLADTLNRHAGVARDFIELFHIRFNPDRIFATLEARNAAEAPVRSRIEGALAQVQSLDEDRILRQLLNLISATLRTNFFQRRADGTPPDTTAFKFDSHAVDVMPQPRPYREIWVYSPRVEGVHLRFAPIARGGIRWSDRAQDFRTEVLGLVKAQLVKNAVIVPSGAKGGFLPKLLPRSGQRDQVMAEGIAAYRIFISTLLDITDNVVAGAIVPPPRVVRYDGDDPYLVVAADKGTATFSDYANEISAAHGHWLGDAFASGGSVGYDHKKMAITAKGAWECVKRHFREIDWDIQNKPFRVAGIGDMSGDVFGNGMLLSPVIKLVAAFDHRDIFIDPSPDTTVSLAERQRLFDLPRSSWQDYNKTLISKGGGVFSRSSKSIQITDEMRSLLRLDGTSATPADIMRAILTSDVDLLWFGGIGTYVRASTETDEQAGDRANDTIRITGADVKAKVIGEGANLGMTQRGRIEFAMRGGRLNTDFIDNSAGVNCSDQEVNIKIALASALQSGAVQPSNRGALLASMTAEVGEACLTNNFQQSLALSLAQHTAIADNTSLTRLMRDLEQRKLLDRRIEMLPSDAQLAERTRAGQGLTRPELAVLLSFGKIALSHDLLASTVPDQPRLKLWLIGYFPEALRTVAEADLQKHQLRREIVATALTNALINRAGPAFPLRIATETGRSNADVATAYLAARDVFATADLFKRIDALDTRVPGSVQIELYLSAQQFVQQTTAWFLTDGAALGDLDGTIARHSAGVGAVRDYLEFTMDTASRREFEATISVLTAKGVPADLARDVVRLDQLADAPAITELAAATGRPAVDVAATYFAIGRYFRISDLVSRCKTIASTDDFDRMALAQASADLRVAHYAFTTLAINSAPAGPIDVAAWLSSKGNAISSAKTAIDQLATSEQGTISRMTVAASRLRGLVTDSQKHGPKALV
jgi:glutamate dehydrogenase